MEFRVTEEKSDNSQIMRSLCGSRAKLAFGYCMYSTRQIRSQSGRGA